MRKIRTRKINRYSPIPGMSIRDFITRLDEYKQSKPDTIVTVNRNGKSTDIVIPDKL